MSDAGLLWGQFRHQNMLLRRTPISVFFALGFPLMFLVLLLALSGNETMDSRAGVPLAQFFTPGVIVFGVMSSTYTNLATTIPINRDDGILKRVLATPLPKWIYIAGRIMSATWFAVLGAAVMVAVAVALFGVRVEIAMVPALVITLLLGSVCMCLLGIAVGSLCPSGDAAPAVANLTFLPIAFVSEIFFPVDNAPRWVQVVGDIFPVKHFAEAMQYGFDSNAQGAGFLWSDLAVIVAWGVAGALVAMRRFSWEPRAPQAGGRRGGGRGRGRRGAKVANVPIVD